MGPLFKSSCPGSSQTLTDMKQKTSRKHGRISTGLQAFVLFLAISQSIVLLVLSANARQHQSQNHATGTTAYTMTPSNATQEEASFSWLFSRH